MVAALVLQPKLTHPRWKESGGFLVRRDPQDPFRLELVLRLHSVSNAPLAAGTGRRDAAPALIRRSLIGTV